MKVEAEAIEGEKAAEWTGQIKQRVDNVGDYFVFLEIYLVVFYQF